MTALTKSGQQQESGQMAWIGCPFQSDMKLKHPSTGSTCSRKVEENNRVAARCCEQLDLQGFAFCQLMKFAGQTSLY